MIHTPTERYLQTLLSEGNSSIQDFIKGASANETVLSSDDWGEPIATVAAKIKFCVRMYQL